MSKKDLGREVFSDTFFNLLQNAGKSGGQELLKSTGNYAVEQVGSVVLDTAFDFIPIVGDAIKNFKIERRFNNIEQFINQLSDKIDFFIGKNEQLSMIDKKIYSDLLIYAIDSVERYDQEEKVAYLVNGLENMIKVEDISYDIGYLYINMLNQLSILDLSVLKLYGRIYIQDDKREFETYEDILDYFHIERHQYQAIQDNLYNLGLLRKKNEKNTEKDFKNIKDNLERIDNNIEQIHSYLKVVNNGRKKNPKLKNIKSGRIKFEIKDRYELNKFGIDFIKYFILDK